MELLVSCSCWCHLSKMKNFNNSCAECVIHWFSCLFSVFWFRMMFIVPCLLYFLLQTSSSLSFKIPLNGVMSSFLMRNLEYYLFENKVCYLEKKVKRGFISCLPLGRPLPLLFCFPLAYRGSESLSSCWMPQIFLIFSAFTKILKFCYLFVHFSLP